MQASAEDANYNTTVEKRSVKNVERTYTKFPGLNEITCYLLTNFLGFVREASKVLRTLGVIIWLTPRHLQIFVSSDSMPQVSKVVPTTNGIMCHIH